MEYKRSVLIVMIICLCSSAYTQTSNAVKVACIGASITAGATLQYPGEQAYPQLLQLKLGNNYSVTNYGVSGTTILRKGDLSYWNTDAYKNALQSNPAIIFIDLGGNDSKLVNRKYLNEFKKDCHDMVQSFKQLSSHPRIVLLLPLPCFEKDTTAINDAVITSQIIPSIRSVAFEDNIELLDMHSLFIDQEALMPDKIHPDAEGSHIIANRLYELLALKTDKDLHLLKRLNKQPDSISFFGYEQANFQLNGKNCIVVQPKFAAVEHPWIWRARFWAHEPQTDVALLERGFAVVYCDVAELFGNNEAIDAWNKFYQLLHNAGLNKKAVLEGMSRAAIYALNWAAVNPDKVACVYIDNPVLDLKMWPAGLGKYPPSREELKIFKTDFNLKTEEDIQHFDGSPIDKVEAIAKGNYPILILSADADEAVNPAENALLFQQKMKALNATVDVIHKPGFKHHPHSLPNATRIVDFIIQHAGQAHAYENTNTNNSQQLMAGTSKINITPITDEPIHDSIYARSLVLDLNGERIAFVSLDLVIFTSDRVEQVCREKYGISKVILCSSHDHSGPLVDNKINFSQSSPFQSFYEDQVIKVVTDAAEHMFAAKIAAGKSSFPQLGFNRLVMREDGRARESWLGDDHYRPENPERIPFGPVDPEVGVLKITDMNNDTRAIMMNYAMHADVVCFNYAVSADYPGAAARKVEEAFGNKVNCLFVQGGGGNIESLMISPRRSGPTDTLQTDYAPMERTGELLAWEVVKLAKNITMPAGNETTINYKIDSLHFKGRYDTSRDFDVHLVTMLINNNISIAVCPGEMFVQFQLDWKDKMKLASANGFLFGYSWSGGKWPGYIADVRSAALGGYGADGGNLIQVGAGENIMVKQLENYYRLTGQLHNSPGK